MAATEEKTNAVEYKDLIFDDSLKLLTEKSEAVSLEEHHKATSLPNPPNPQTRRPSLQPSALAAAAKIQNSVSNEVNPRSVLFVPAAVTWKTNAKPVLVLSSSKRAAELGIEYTSLSNPSSLPLLCGSSFHESATPVCSNYGGYQNGTYQILGDGRSVSLGFYKNNMIQIRGIGPNAISKKKGGKDGFITLSNAIHEFLLTEALVQLKIPTTRCLSVMASAFPCSRGVTPTEYATAHLTRFAPTFLRFGHFEYFHLRGEQETVRLLADSVIEQFYPDAISLENKEILYSTNLIAGDLFAKEDQNIDGGILASGEDVDERVQNIGTAVSVPLNRYAIFFRRVVERTAHMLAHWHANGFVHGLMNTENMSILGLTMNVARSGIMDIYDPQWTSNPADKEGRYAFDSQPAMAAWALSRLSLSLVSLVGESFASPTYKPSLKSQLEEEALLKQPSSMPANRTIPLGFMYNSSKAENVLREITCEFDTTFSKKLGELFFTKLGLHSFVEKDFQLVINPLLDLLATTGTDYVNFFRLICYFPVSETKYNLGVAYQPHGLHDPGTLRDNPANDCMTLLLKSLVSLHDKEAVSQPALKLSAEQTPSTLPTLEGTSDAWKIWAHVYRARLLSQLPANRRTPEAIAEEDAIRQKRLRAINPKHTLRTWVLADALAEVEKQFPPISDLAQNPRRKQESIGLGAQVPCFQTLDQIKRILIDDMYGEVFDTKTGWKDAKDKEKAALWSHDAPPMKSNLRTIFDE